MYVFLDKKKLARTHCFTFLQISLIYGLPEDNWILISSSVFSMLRSVLIEVWREYRLRLIVGKMKNILFLFSDSCKYSFMSCQKSTRGRVLKVGCSEEYETISFNFLWYFSLKAIDLSYILMDSTNALSFLAPCKSFGKH